MAVVLVVIRPDPSRVLGIPGPVHDAEMVHEGGITVEVLGIVPAADINLL